MLGRRDTYRGRDLAPIKTNAFAFPLCIRQAPLMRLQDCNDSFEVLSRGRPPRHLRRRFKGRLAPEFLLSAPPLNDFGGTVWEPAASAGKVGDVMKQVLAASTLACVCSCLVLAQEPKPVPKGSVRVTIPGCSKDRIFTAIPRTEDQAGSSEVPPGMHLRMNAKKPVIKEIEAREGSVIVIVGVMKTGQPGQGVKVGGVTIGPASPPRSPVGGAGGGVGVGSGFELMNSIDLEGWRLGTGECPRR